MARKSRKETAAVAVQEADAACRAAIYVRLSVEDTHTHSVSIETQQMIIARYLEQYPEISVYDTYIDNGATGTNFHRPGFQQILPADAKHFLKMLHRHHIRVVLEHRQIPLRLSVRLFLNQSAGCDLAHSCPLFLVQYVDYSAENTICKV